jgi:hypothetical protein
MSNDSSPNTKKRKANDGRATVPNDGGGGGLFSSLLSYFSGRRDATRPTASSTCGGENLTQKMDAMMQMMIRMEERCCRLEAECSSLKAMLDTKTNAVKEHVDCKIDSLVRHHEYNNMLVKNQSWKYKTPVHSAEYWEDNGYDEDVAEYLADGSEPLKNSTEKLRRGEFPDYSVGNRKGIDLEWGEGDPILDRAAKDIMHPYWVEFTMALKQFTPAFGVLPSYFESYFNLENIQLTGNVAWLLKDALMHKPFQSLKFVNKADVGDNEGMKIVDIIDIMKSNKHLRRLTIGNNRIQQDNMKNLFSALLRGSIVELDLSNCFENGLGDDMMEYLLINGGSKLQRLGLESNEIASSSVTLLANFLATNPPLKALDLSNNDLSGDSVYLLANALRSNTSLRFLQLFGNPISNADYETFRLVLHGDSNLNSIADSNHSCVLEGVGFSWNVDGFQKNGAWHEATESFNRARKIYNLLSERNKSISTSNVQHFDDIDVKLLPVILKTVQRYESAANATTSNNNCRVKALSIVYEVMRKWDKVFPLYTDGR